MRANSFSRPVVRSLVRAVVLMAALASAGCGAGPEQIGPSGVDGLVVPTPTADPDDFDESPQNPWFPLEPGAVSRFTVEGETLATGAEISVLDEGRTIAGVETVAVTEVVRAGAQDLTETTSWYAADDAGNIWLFGQRVTARIDGRDRIQSSWTAGEQDSAAGLVMPADPRVGDGFAAGSRSGELAARAEVLEVRDSVRVEEGEFEDVVVIEVTRPVLPGIVETRYYAPGVGLVLTEQRGAAATRSELVERRN